MVELTKKLSLLAIGLVVSLLLVVSAQADSNACDSLIIHDQLHTGAVSVRLLGNGVLWSGVKLSGKYHYSGSRSLMLTLGLKGEIRQQKYSTSDGERSKLNSLNLHTEFGANYLFHFMPKSLISPYFGGGPVIGYSYWKSRAQYNSGNTEPDISRRYGIGLNALFGFEWTVSAEISFIAEYSTGISYTLSIRDYLYGENRDRRKTFYENAYLDYEKMSVGIAFYIR